MRSDLLCLGAVLGQPGWRVNFVIQRAVPNVKFPRLFCPEEHITCTPRAHHVPTMAELAE